MRKEILRIHNLTINKHDEVLLQNVHFQIYDREIVGLIAREDKGANELIEYILTQNQISTCLIEHNSHLLDALSIAENVFVVRNRFRKYFIRESVLEDQLQRYCVKNGIALQVGKRVSELTEYERCVVELIKADIFGISLIILENPSNYISQMQMPKFHELLRKFKGKGMSFLYVGYHHQEVFTIADRTALLANGYIKKIFLKYEMTDEAIAPYINPILERRDEKGLFLEKEKGGAIDLETIHAKRCKEEVTFWLSDYRLSVRKSECLALIDMDNTLKGRIMNDFQDGYHNPNAIRMHSKSHKFQVIPEDFVNQFLFRDLSYFNNLIFLLDRKLGRSLLPGRIKENVRENYRKKVGDVVDSNDIAGLNTIELLRLVYYKVLLCKPDLMICLQPYAGGDMHCRMEVTKLLGELQNEGIAVLIVSSNFADIMDVANRVMMIENGEIRMRKG